MVTMVWSWSHSPGGSDQHFMWGSELITRCIDKYGWGLLEAVMIWWIVMSLWMVHLSNNAPPPNNDFTLAILGYHDAVVLQSEENIIIIIDQYNMNFILEDICSLPTRAISRLWYHFVSYYHVLRACSNWQCEVTLSLNISWQIWRSLTYLLTLTRFCEKAIVERERWTCEMRNLTFTC